MAGLKCCTFVHANPFNKQLSIFCAETFVHQCSSLSKMKCLKVWSEEAHENNWLFDESFHFNNKISPFCCCRWLEFQEDIFCFQSFISGNGSLVCNLTFHPKQPYGNMWKRHEKWICVHGHKLCFFSLQSAQLWNWGNVLCLRYPCFWESSELMVQQRELFKKCHVLNFHPIHELFFNLCEMIYCLQPAANHKLSVIQ